MTSPGVLPQQTLRHEARIEGTGLHSGQQVRLRLLPAEAGHGLRFVRTDLPSAPEVQVQPAALCSGMRCTALEQQGVGVRTVEHLLAALAACGVDHARIELDAEELPILDGSARPWLDLVLEAGLAPLEGAPPTLVVREPVVERLGASVLIALPAPRLRLTVASLTDHPVAGQQLLDVVIDPEVFATSIAPARTFCFEEEVAKLQAAGLVRGGSLDNALVVHADRYSSPLRVPQEMAAHKLLDLLGDLAG